MPTTIFYNPHGQDGGYRFRAELKGVFDIADADEHENIAEQCAEHWHNDCDGFEGEWPRVFILFADGAGPSFARFEVGRETVPQFHASPA